MTPARFSKETKQAIFERDWYICIIKWCTNRWVDPHHVYFWLQSNTDKYRNDTNKWVTLCRTCHEKCHPCKSWQWIRQEAIDYIEKLV